MSSLAKLLAKAKEKNLQSSESETFFDTAVSEEITEVTLPQTLEVESKATPPEIEVKAEESTTAIGQIPHSVVSSLQPRPGSLEKLLSTPKPDHVIVPPSKEEMIENMSLEEISKIEGEDVAYEDGATRFRGLFDLLDEKIKEAGGDVNMTNVDVTRNIISQIMIDWKANPDYSTLVLDEDVHNVMRWVWKRKEYAIESLQKKEEKKNKTATKKLSAPKFELDLEDF